MSLDRETTPEAELEAALARVLPMAFPLLVGQIQHQLRFELRLGHQTKEHDGASSWKMAGKADILLIAEGRSLAMLELKREDKPLTEGDRDQVLSYSRQLTPQPPLSITSNGKDVRFYLTATGEAWNEGDRSADTVRRLFESAAKLAAENTNWAVETLLGPTTGVWLSAVRQETETAISHLTAEISEKGRPFVRGFAIPRKRTQDLTGALDNGAPMVHLSGAPLSGKTNVLREFCKTSAADSKYACLFIPSGSSGPGLFQRIANVLSAALDWPVSVDDVRQWLRRMAKHESGTNLVIVVDDVTAGCPVAADIEELASMRYSKGLRIVVGTDNTATQFRSLNGRTPTAVAAYSSGLHLEGLDEDEFEGAVETFRGLKVCFGLGANFCAEYRAPWVLRDILVYIASTPPYPNQAAIWPSVFGIEVFAFWRKALVENPTMARGYRSLARDYVYDEAPGSISDQLSRLNTFAVRGAAVSATSLALEPKLIESGWLRQYRSNSGDDLLVPTSPELFLCELAGELASWFRDRLKIDQIKALNELMAKVGRGPFGELLGASVIFELAKTTAGLSLALVAALLQSPPTHEEMRQGRFIKRINNIDVGFQVYPDGTMHMVNASGDQIGKVYQIDEFPALIGDYTPWMVLSYLARFPLETVLDDEQVRLDHMILLEVGQHPHPLLSPAEESQGFDSFDLNGMELVHIDNGIIEPVTASMYNLFLDENEDLDLWFEAAVETNSVPLLHRVLVALQSIAASGLSEGAWADDKLRNMIAPALTRLCPELGLSVVDGPHVDVVRAERNS